MNSELILAGNTAIFLAKVFGGLLTISGFAIALNSDRAMKMVKEMSSHHGVAFLMVFIPALLGSFLLAVHNDWNQDWTMIFTILGWMMIIAAIFRGWFTHQWLKTISDVKKNYVQVSGFIMGLIGLFLLYKGWWS